MFQVLNEEVQFMLQEIRWSDFAIRIEEHYSIFTKFNKINTQIFRGDQTKNECSIQELRALFQNSRLYRKYSFLRMPKNKTIKIKTRKLKKQWPNEARSQECVTFTWTWQ